MLESGLIDGKKWIAGTVSIGKGKTVEIDTRTGKGVNVICKHLEKFILIQTLKVKFPSYFRDDTAQELYIMALEAIPHFNAEKNANMLTFLESHIQKRIINKFKYFSEQKRVPICKTARTFKFRCPSCRKFFLLHKGESLKCKKCGLDDSLAKWKRYNVILPSLSWDEMTSEQDHENSFHNTEKVISALFSVRVDIEEDAIKRLDFLKQFNKLKDHEKTIIKNILEGKTTNEIAAEMQVSGVTAYNNAAKIIKFVKTTVGETNG
jgi:RNA polymerase sigma factor (sigma-70 family)